MGFWGEEGVCQAQDMMPRIYSLCMNSGYLLYFNRFTSPPIDGKEKYIVTPNTFNDYKIIGSTY